MARVLLINPSYQGSYGGSKASIINPIHPTLGLATIAGVAKKLGHTVKIFDMSFRAYNYSLVEDVIRSFKPDVVGITATTPLVNQMRDISVLVKDISQDILVIGGGPHVTAMPVEALAESLLDAVCVGEADYSFGEICDGRRLKEILGLYYRDGDTVVFSGERPLIEDLDQLPFPALDLYDKAIYQRHMSHLLVRNPPATMLEFSRGCVFKCDFCASKITMGFGYRKKSPERCAAEVKYIHSLGFREFMLADDIFTSDQRWASKVCDSISRTRVPISWSCTNGIRVESADDKLFSRMKKAGCYRVSFGFESGDDEVLKKFGKGGKASINAGIEAVQLARSAGIDTNGYFLLGLSPDTEKSMQKTISYARQLPLDMMKFGIAIAFPGTLIFDFYRKKNMIKSFNWDDYHIYTQDPPFSHTALSYPLILEYIDVAYQRAIIRNPPYILRRMARGIRTGEFFWDAFYFLKFLAMPSTNQATTVEYYAQDRWPQYEY